MGRDLILQLVSRGHDVLALVRVGKERDLSKNSRIVVGDALKGPSYANAVPGADTFVHLVGVPHANPSKAEQFRTIDLKSLQEAVSVAVAANVKHFVYVSVAQPAPIMKAYLEVRAECEGIIRKAGLNATILRPWYVLGPGHRWPYLLMPVYWLFGLLPATRKTTQRLGLVRLKEMIASMCWAVENPCQGVRILEVPQIRQIHL